MHCDGVSASPMWSSRTDCMLEESMVITVADWKEMAGAPERRWTLKVL